MRTTRLAASALSVALLAGSGLAMCAQNYGPPPPPPGAGYPQEGWYNVPPEFREVQQRGFHDGIEGARRDFQNHRPPDVNNRDEYRHPHVDGPDRRDYRIAFRRGYQVGVQHFYGPGPGPRY